MYILGLAPLPVRPDQETPASESASWGDFVTDEAIREVSYGACYERMPVAHEELCLSSCDEDFAGMALTKPLFHEPAPRLFKAVTWPDVITRTAVHEAPKPRTRSIFRSGRAAPPSLPVWDAQEAGLAARSGYRWWVPGLVGVAATFMLSAIFFVFSREAATMIGNSTAVPHPVRAQYFDPKIDPAIETADKNAEQPAMAASDLIFSPR